MQFILSFGGGGCSFDSCFGAADSAIPTHQLNLGTGEAFFSSIACLLLTPHLLLVAFPPPDMFNNILQRKNFSIRRNATRRWKQATGQENSNASSHIQEKLRQQKSNPQEPLSVVIKGTSMNMDQQKQAVEIANFALDTCNLESDIATTIKQKMDEITGQTWHVVVGRNFGTHVTWQQYVHFEAGKITILVFQWQ